MPSLSKRPSNMTKADYAASVATVRGRLQDALHELDRLQLSIAGNHLSMAIDSLPDLGLPVSTKPSINAFSDIMAAGESDT